MNSINKVTLGIDFHDGFENDTVVVIINGQEVFRQEYVNTSLQAYAATFKTEIKKGTTLIKIVIPTRNLDCARKDDMTHDTQLIVSIIGNEIECMRAPEAYGLA